MASYGLLGRSSISSLQLCFYCTHDFKSLPPASTTTMQCLASVLYGAEAKQLTRANVSFLVKAYSPFILIPLVMLIDMTLRSMSLIKAATDAVEEIRERKKQ